MYAGGVRPGPGCSRLDPRCDLVIKYSRLYIIYDICMCCIYIYIYIV